jgi:TldD protein
MPPVELVPAPAVKDGRWSMPVGRDPFAVSREEILDTLTGTSYQSLRTWDNAYLQVVLSRLETVFASSDGSYLSQTRYGSEAKVGMQFVRPEYKGVQFVTHRVPGMANVLPLAGRGWEYIGRAPWYDILEQVRADQERYLALPEKPVDVGRYDVVMDATTAARLLSATLGTATELDRALGYEANAGGTTYLNDPVAMVGKEPIGPTGFGLTVTANRSLPGGMATVKWDEEGVEPEDFPLVKDGILTDFQTTRESAGWLKDGYTRLGRALRSHGCAGGATALDATQLQRPNLRLEPGREKAGYPELVSRLTHGIAVEEAGMDMDFNALNGMARLDPDFPSTRFFEVRKGRKVARLVPKATALLFRAPELWKSLLALGGADSVRPIPVRASKGEPPQETWHTVEAPPMLLRQLAVIDPTR